MSHSSHSSCDDTILYLEDVDSDIGECYADPEPPTGPQRMNIAGLNIVEAEAVPVRIEDKHALSDGDSAQAEAFPHVPQ